jgi:hypothetical protein
MCNHTFHILRNVCTTRSSLTRANKFMCFFATETPSAAASATLHCGDVELAGYLTNAAGPVPLVLDLHMAHDRVGSSTDPTLNGQPRYPNNLDQSHNDTASDKVRKYRADYNNNPPNTVSFMSAIVSTSGRLHIEFVRLLFLQTHRQTDRFFFSFRSFVNRWQLYVLRLI